MTIWQNIVLVFGRKSYDYLAEHLLVFGITCYHCGRTFGMKETVLRHFHILFSPKEHVLYQ